MKKLSEYLLIWAVGGCIYYTFEICVSGIFSLDHVCSGWDLSCILHRAGQGWRLERSTCSSGVSMHGICDILRIYYRNDREQMA